jgi:tRNA threonylcarbamoyladenosine biosynthesis protein TsaB
MKLSIDTSDSERIVVGLDGKIYKADSREEKSQKLLSFIDEIFRKQGRKLKDVKEIKVNVGPGSYTGLRVGVSVANAIGWSLGIPVNGRDSRKGEIVEIKYD